MCTVTYLPINKDNFILTSNRDVPYAREKAVLPQKYVENDIELFYPKDGKAGGTWIGISSKNRLICALNGGFDNHKSRESYKKSRGKIVLDLLRSDCIEIELNKIDLHDIEPFTFIIIDWNEDLKLTEFVWDGVKKHLKKLPQKPLIWSSSTLYTNDVKNMRKKWFTDWQYNHDFNQKSILKFHHKAGIGDDNIDVVLKRKMVGTVSITSVMKNEMDVNMYYEDIAIKSKK